MQALDVFSVQPLKKVLSLKYKKVTVLTRPPKRQGRGMKEKNNPLAEFALQNNLETLMPESPNDNNFIAKLEEKNMTYLFHALMEGLCRKTLWLLSYGQYQHSPITSS